MAHDQTDEIVRKQLYALLQIRGAQVLHETNAEAAIVLVVQGANVLGAAVQHEQDKIPDAKLAEELRLFASWIEAGQVEAIAVSTIEG